MVLEPMAEATLRRDEFRLFQKLMYEQAGIALADCKLSLVEGRLRKRLRQLRLPTFGDYYRRALEDEAELRQCVNLLTTNETYFFRHKRHWDFLAERVIPDWTRGRPHGGTFRFWSAAASTGEEAYSAAILLHDLLGEAPERRYDIEATDINEDVLARARSALYADYAVQKITPEGLRRYFRTVSAGSDRRHAVREDLKARVRFMRRNLLEPSHGPPFDAVFLRNVIIYFDAESKALAIGNAARRIVRGGYLFLGGAETLAACQDEFASVEPTIYRKL